MNALRIIRNPVAWAHRNRPKGPAQTWIKKNFGRIVRQIRRSQA